MEQVFLNDCELLSDMMHGGASEGKTVYAVLFYEQAVELMKRLLDYSDVDLCDIELAPGDVNGYYHEYYVVLDADMVIHIQPAWHAKNEYCGEGYYDFDADLIYIDGEANSAILRGQEMNSCYEIVWEDDDCCFGCTPVVVNVTLIPALALIDD